jgi:hypothetical protein
MTIEEKVNSLTRLFIIITSIGFILTNNNMFLITGILFISIITLIGYAKINGLIQYIENPFVRKTTEGFIPNMNSKDVEGIIKNKYTSSDTNKNTDNFEKPTPNNPLSNVLLTQIHDEPNRKPAPPAFLPEVENDIIENTKEMIRSNNPEINDIDKRLFNEVGDNFTLDRSMRQFYSMPNTQVPNDQKSFAEFCYGSMTSCKEGHEQSCERNAFRHITGY